MDILHPKAVIGTNSWGSAAYGVLLRGSSVDDDTIRKAMLTAKVCDLKIYDLARDYGLGKAQKMIGEFGTDGIFISAKYTPFSGYKAGCVRESLEKDLSDFKREYVDIYWLHLPTDIELHMKEIITLVREGKIHHIGVSNFNLEECKTSKPYHTKNSDMMLKNYRFGYDRQTVLHFDDMPLPTNEIVAITGRNGAGKSTFVRCFCGLEKKFKGQTIIDGKAYKPKDILRKCYLVMQDVNHQLFCESVEDEVLLGAADDTDDTQKKARRLMEKLGVWELRDRHPMSLSGGQKQRVAICSAVLAGKDILVFDEPTSGLDYRHMLSTAELFKDLRGMGKSVFIITHDSELIERCCTCELNIVGGKANLYERSI